MKIKSFLTEKTHAERGNKAGEQIEMVECRNSPALQYKVLVRHAKNFGAYWGNEQLLSKKKVMVDFSFIQVFHFLPLIFRLAL